MSDVTNWSLKRGICDNFERSLGLVREVAVIQVLSVPSKTGHK